MEISQVRCLKELGPNFQKIVTRLLANQNLLRYLTYTDKDPLNSGKANITPEAAYIDGEHGVIRIIPRIDDKETSNSILAINILKGMPDSVNDEFMNIQFTIEIFVPYKQWIIKDSNLRPFAIIGEVLESLDKKTINGLGKIKSYGFATNYYTEEISSYLISFGITQYN